MLTRQELEKVNNDVFLTQEEFGAKMSVISRGLPYYGKLGTLYPVHLMSFKSMHNRSTFKHESFSRDVKGFINFLLEMGDVPYDMTRPTNGRRDHKEGYVPGNFRWQELSENSQDNKTNAILGHGIKPGSKIHKLKSFLDECSPLSILKTDDNLFGYVYRNRMLADAKYLGYTVTSLGKGRFTIGLVAQLNRAAAFEAVGCGFESL